MVAHPTQACKEAVTYRKATTPVIFHVPAASFTAALHGHDQPFLDRLAVGAADVGVNRHFLGGDLGLI